MTRFEIHQLGWVVPDLDAALEHWTGTVGVGPFRRADRLHPDPFHYRGQPTPIELSIAIGYSGALQIELIQQHDGLPSLYNDRPPWPDGGQHHLGCYVRDFDERYAVWQERGYAAVQEGALATRFAYFETDALPGTIMELVELSDPIDAMLTDLRQASAEWDGRSALYSPSEEGAKPRR